MEDYKCLSCVFSIGLTPEMFCLIPKYKSCVSCCCYCCCCSGWGSTLLVPFIYYSIPYFGFINSLPGGILDPQLSSSFLPLDFGSMPWIHFRVGSHKSFLSFFLFVCIFYPNGQNQCLSRRSLIKVCSCSCLLLGLACTWPFARATSPRSWLWGRPGKGCQSLTSRLSSWTKQVLKFNMFCFLH